MRSIVTLALCFLLLSAAAAQAEPVIAVFNVQKVASECEALQEAKTALETKFGPQKEALEKQRAVIEKKAAGLKGKATEKQQAELNKLHREYNESAQAFMRVFQADEMRIRRDIDTVINAAAKELAARKGYSMILDSAAAVYADPALDVSDELLAVTNEVWQKGRISQADAKDAKDATDAKDMQPDKADRGGTEAAKPSGSGKAGK